MEPKERKKHSIFKDTQFYNWLSFLWETYRDTYQLTGVSKDSMEIIMNLFVQTTEDIYSIRCDLHKNRVYFLREKDYYWPKTRDRNDVKNNWIETKIGRLIRKLDNKNTLSEVDIQYVTENWNEYCSKFNLDNYNLQIWDSTKILYAYHENNYSKKAGSLGSSCMRYDKEQQKMEFYKNNGIKIVVLLDDKNKIMARALLWPDCIVSNRVKTKTMMDRVYTCDDRFFPVYKEFAKRNNFIQRNISGNTKTFFEQNSIKEYRLSKPLTNIQWKLPYADTMYKLYYENKIIANYGREGEVVELRSTDGQFPHLNPNLVREVFSAEGWLEKEEGTYIKRYKGWVHNDHITTIHDVIYSIFDSKIVRLNNFVGCSGREINYGLKTETLYCDWYGVHILKINATPLFNYNDATKQFTKEGYVDMSNTPPDGPQPIQLWTGHIVKPTTGIITNNGIGYLQEHIEPRTQTDSLQYYFGVTYKRPRLTHRHWYSDPPLHKIPPDNILDEKDNNDIMSWVFSDDYEVTRSPSISAWNKRVSRWSHKTNKE